MSDLIGSECISIAITLESEASEHAAEAAVVQAAVHNRWAIIEVYASPACQDRCLNLSFILVLLLYAAGAAAAAALVLATTNYRRIYTPVATASSTKAGSVWFGSWIWGFSW